MRCARAIQEAQAAANADRAPAERIETRIGVHVGDRPATGRRAVFLIAPGAGLFLAATFGNWRSGTPPWWLVLGGIVVIVVGLTHLRRPRARDRPY